MGCKSRAMMVIGSEGVESGERCRERTWDQDPGAAQRSTMRRTFGGGGAVVVVVVALAVSMVGKRLNCSFSWRSLNAERAR